MTAADNVRFPLVERREAPAKIEARLRDVAEKLHIGHILHKMLGQLSGGERQRVAIARALVRDPAAYLMDDPISALDARLREETRVELKRIQREAGRMLIYVTHDQEEAMSVADWMAILEDGAIRQIGRPVEIYDHPTTTYVARFLDNPIMNILPVQATSAGFETAAGALQVVVGAQAGVVDMGLRPEDLRVSAWEGGADVPAPVSEVEPLGGYTVVTLTAGTQPCLPPAKAISNWPKLSSTNPATPRCGKTTKRQRRRAVWKTSRNWSRRWSSSKTCRVFWNTSR